MYENLPKMAVLDDLEYRFGADGFIRYGLVIVPGRSLAAHFLAHLSAFPYHLRLAREKTCLVCTDRLAGYDRQLLGHTFYHRDFSQRISH